MRREENIILKLSIFFLISIIYFHMINCPPAFSQAQEFRRLRTTPQGAPIETNNIPTGKISVEYYIAVGDKLEVFIWQNSELSRDVVVGPDGTISYPFIGRIKAEGLTISQVENIIREKLSYFFNQTKALETGKFAEDITLTETKPPTYEYVINEDDVFEIFVWQNPDLSREVIVGPDGTVSCPLVGRMQVAGLRVSQVEDKIKEKLAEYVKFPSVSIMMKKYSRFKPLQVSVILKEYAGSKIIILGAVNYPGIYNYTGSINLINAVALAGDFQEQAQRNSVIVVRGNLTENPEVRRINMAKVITRGIDNKSEDIMLRAGDVIFVPKTFVANFTKFLSDIGPVIGQAKSILGFRDDIRRLTGHSS